MLIFSPTWIQVPDDVSILVMLNPPITHTGVQQVIQSIKNLSFSVNEPVFLLQAL